MKFSVTETVTRAYVYEVEAEDETEAERLVLENKGERISERDETISRTFEIEEVK